jgi:hypothetical protein
MKWHLFITLPIEDHRFDHPTGKVAPMPAEPTVAQQVVTATLAADMGTLRPYGDDTGHVVLVAGDGSRVHLIREDHLSEQRKPDWFVARDIRQSRELESRDAARDAAHP